MATNGHTSSRKPLKTLEIVQDKKFPTLLRLQFAEGGKVPEVISGTYKSRKLAQRAIDYYNEGYNRNKIYPQAPKEKKVEEPKRSVEKDAEETKNSG